MFGIDYIKHKFKKYTKDAQLIEELSQIAYIKLHEYSKKSYNENQYKKLIYLLIKSVYIDYYRHNKSIKSKFKLVAFEELNNLDFNELYNFYTKKENINIDVLFSALDKLTEIQRDIIFLRFYYSLKYEDIGRLLGLPKNTALSHFHKAKIKLRSLLSKNDVYYK